MTKATDEIIAKGNELNKVYQSYKNSRPEEKKSKWQEFLVASDEYRKDVRRYISGNPADIARCL